MPSRNETRGIDAEPERRQQNSQFFTNGKKATDFAMGIWKRE